MTMVGGRVECPVECSRRSLTACPVPKGKSVKETPGEQRGYGVLSSDVGSQRMKPARMDEGRSHLFTLRLWAENLGNGQTEWRAQVRHVTSGETRYLRDWSALVELLLVMLPSTRTVPLSGTSPVERSGQGES